MDIGHKKNTFIHAQDIAPKKDLTKEERKDINVKELVKVGMPILVQVKRDSTNKKGARVSTHISLPGRYLVLMPNTGFVTISQKIENIEERQRLLELVKSNLPEDIGAIIRTSAENKEEKEIKQDMYELIKKWNSIKEKAHNNKKVPELIYENDSITRKILIDLIDKKIDNIWVNDEQILEEVKKIISQMQTNQVPEIKIEKDIEKKYNLARQIEKISQRKIWLKCGGFITIDKTEALTAIDVNSGKYIGKEDLERTVYLVNREATEEIAKQLRLRDLEGIIMIDYIDMKKEENKKKIRELLKDELKKDRSKTQVLEFTKLNLLEMTRKHMYSNLEEI